MFWLALFVVLTLALLTCGWRQLRTPNRRGFYRALAFVTLFGLVCLAGPVWFVDPFSPRQVISWVILAGSAALAANAFAMLHAYGAPTGGIETTQALVEHGAYRWVRHPLYGSLILAGAGAALKHPTLWSAALLLILAGLLVVVARVEEVESTQRFGEAYAEYRRRTARFIPYVF